MEIACVERRRGRHVIIPATKDDIYKRMLEMVVSNDVLAGGSLHADASCYGWRRRRTGAQMGGCLGCQLSAHNNQWNAAIRSNIP